MGRLTTYFEQVPKVVIEKLLAEQNMKVAFEPEEGIPVVKLAADKAKHPASEPKR